MAKKKEKKLLKNKCVVSICGIHCVIEGNTIEEILDEFTEVRNICFRCGYDTMKIQQSVEVRTAIAGVASSLNKIGLSGLRPVLDDGALEAEKATGGETTTIEQITEQVLGTGSEDK